MKSATIVSMDRSGRLVIPKSIRQQAGLESGVELELIVANGKVELSPAPRRVRIVAKGRLKVAVPEEPGELLTAKRVRRTLDEVRARD